MTISITDAWLELPGRLVSENGTVRLREPPTADIPDIIRRLRDNEYQKPFIVDDGHMRRLHFSLDYVQSEMNINEPYALNFAYTREMMAFLLFVPRPRHVLLLGLGGGSLTKFCYRQLPAACITTVEIDRNVLDLGSQFDLPTDDPRMRLVHGDAVDYISTTTDEADVILIDGCDRRGIFDGFCSAHFYSNLRARLSPRGIVVMNLIGPGRLIDAHLRHLADAFGGRVLLRSLRHGGNRIAFGFCDPRFPPDWLAIQRAATNLQQEHGLDFPAFARKLRQGRRPRLGP